MKRIVTALLMICCTFSAGAQDASAVPHDDTGTVPALPVIPLTAPHATVHSPCPLAGSFTDGHVTFIAKSSALTLYVSTTEFIPQKKSFVLDGNQRMVTYPAPAAFSHEQSQWLLWFSVNNLVVGQGYQLMLEGADCSSPSGEVSYTAWLQWSGG
jgi:hypothetical protein